MTFDPVQILSAFDAAAVDYVLCGDAAGLIHGAPYGAFAVEITASPNEANLDRVAGALERLEARLLGESASGRCFATPSGMLEVSVAQTGPGGYSDLSRAASLTTVGGIDVRVASLTDVIRMKETAGRDRDRGLLYLLRVTHEESLQLER